ncbi:hypothetical protein PMAYCL1PPCAC_26699, partial [Pristionchus mayeri]
IPTRYKKTNEEGPFESSLTRCPYHSSRFLPSLISFRVMVETVNDSMDPLMDSLPSESVDITSKLFTDYINVFLQCAFVLIGLPVNISTLVYIVHKYRHARSFLLLLHINLNITDVLVLAVYSTGYVGWLITYEWRAGDLLCKIMRFSDVLIFSASSNIMVSIAVYRLCALRSPMWVSAVGHSRVPRIVLSAWAAALLIALPQLFFWRTSTAEFVLEDGVTQTATQCVSVWTANLNSNISLTERDHIIMMGYNMSQILLMFYIPLAIVATCYVLILRDIYSTLNVDGDESSVLYAAEITRLSSCGKKRSQAKPGDSSGVILQQRTLRGQDKFQRAKVRSLR